MTVLPPALLYPPAQEEAYRELAEPAETARIPQEVGFEGEAVAVPIPHEGEVRCMLMPREAAAEYVHAERELIRRGSDEDRFLEWERCRRSRLWFIARWVDIESKFPLRGGRTVPFLPFPYQVRIIRLYDRARGERKGIFEDKSRQLGLSWLWMALFLHGLLFEEQASFFATSRRRDEVDDGGSGSTTRSLFGRVRFMYEALPPFLARGHLSFKLLQIRNQRSGTYLNGEAATANIARSASYTAGLLDEFAHIEQSESAWASADEAIECPIVSSTPEGEDNKFADFHKKLSRPGNAVEAMLRERFLVNRSHWREHPVYAAGIERGADGKLTSPWYRRACSSKTPEKAAQEYDISYSGSLPGRYYPEFSRGVHVPADPVPLRRDLWLYLSCDHGLADTEIWGLWQTDAETMAELVGEWHTVPEGQKTGADLTSREVARDVLAWLQSLGLGLRNLQGVFPDPSGAAREQTSGQSHHGLLLDEWAKRGQYVPDGVWIPANNEVDAGIESTRLLMRGSYNGRDFTFRVSPACTLTIDSLINYRRKVDRSGRVLATEAPGWQNHGADMVRYFAHTLFPALGDAAFQREPEPYTTATRGRI